MNDLKYKHFWKIGLTYKKIKLCAHLDWQADNDEQQICSSKTGQKCIGWGVERALPHHSQDYQQVSKYSQSKCKTITNIY